MDRRNQTKTGLIKAIKLENFRMYNLRNDPKRSIDEASENLKKFESMKREMVELHNEIVVEAIDWREFS